MVLIFSIMISLLCPSFVSAKTITGGNNTTISYGKNELIQDRKAVVKKFSKDNVMVSIKDKSVNQTETTDFRQLNKEIEIVLDETDNKSYTTSINDVCKIEYSVFDEKGSISRTKIDGSVSVKITLKVDYKISNDYVSITKVTSKLVACNGSKRSNVGSGVFIDSNKLIYGQTGFYKGGYKEQYDSKKLPNYACTKSYTPPKNWKAVYMSKATVGANQTVYLHRGNRKWSVTVIDNIVG